MEKDQNLRPRKLRVGETLTVNGVKGTVSRPGRMIDANSVRGNPAFDPNYVSEQGRYNGPLWHPLGEDALAQSGRWNLTPDIDHNREK